MRFLSNVVTCHTSDNRGSRIGLGHWSAKGSGFARQGDINQANILRHIVNHAATKLKHGFLQNTQCILDCRCIARLVETYESDNSCKQGVANKISRGEYGILADRFNTQGPTS